MDNELYAWGSNKYGQLGSNNKDNQGEPHRVIFQTVPRNDRDEVGDSRGSGGSEIEILRNMGGPDPASAVNKFGSQQAATVDAAG